MRHRAANLVVADRQLSAAIAFSLEAEGITVMPHHSLQSFLDQRGAGCIVIDLEPLAYDPLACLVQLREAGIHDAVILLTSCPSPNLRLRVGDTDVQLVEKPLLTDTLLSAVSRVVPVT